MRRSLFSTPPPTAAAEIAPHRVTALSLADRGAQRVVSGYAVEPLPAGAVTPALNGTNIAQPAVVAEAMGRALDRLETRPRRVGLVIPDSAAKVSIVRFDKVPARVDDLDQLVRFQVRKSAPFHIEDAQVSYTPGTAIEGGGREFVVVVARRDIVLEYETACRAAGVEPGTVDLATLDLVNLALATPPAPAGDWLLVHVAPSYGSIAILRGQDLMFFRNRGTEGDGALTDLVHQTAMYYQDRLGGVGFDRVVLAGSGGDLALAGTGMPDVRRDLEQRLTTRVETLDLTKATVLADRIVATPALLDALAPAVGLVLRELAA